MPMPMVGVRLPESQVQAISRLAGGQQTTSIIIRRLIAEGLAQLQEERDRMT